MKAHGHVVIDGLLFALLFKPYGLSKQHIVTDNNDVNIVHRHHRWKMMTVMVVLVLIPMRCMRQQHHQFQRIRIEHLVQPII